MSEENVEIARRGIVEINSFYRTGEFSLLQELCDPDFVLQPSGMFPEHEEMRGPEGLLKFIRGQTGVAPNAIELHPVLKFLASRCSH